MPCSGNEQGHILQTSTLTTLPNGVTHQTAWEDHTISCQPLIAVQAWDAVSMSEQGLILGAFAAGSGGVAQILAGNLESIDCRQATLQREQGEDKSDNENERHVEFNTCGDQTDIEALEQIGEVRIGLEGMDTYSSACGGTAGNFLENLNGHTGTVTHPIWSGNVTYEREVFTHDMDDNLINASSENRSHVEDWRGQSIECNRAEELFISCATVYPQLSNYDPINANGFNFRRGYRLVVKLLQGLA